MTVSIKTPTATTVTPFTAVEPFPFLIWQQFLSRAECDQLVHEAESNLAGSQRRTVMGGRALVPNTSVTFQELINRSPAWAQLVTTLSSPEFLEQLGVHLKLESRYVLRPVFTSVGGRLNNMIQRMRSTTQQTQLANATPSQLLSLAALRLTFLVRRYLSAIVTRLSGRVAYELLYDYSLARQGYVREIHRDSDARDIVFLLYLNSTPQEDGGSLQLHRLRDGVSPLPRPNPDDCSLITSIAPEIGTLVAFRNTSRSYHSVELVTGDSTQRHFIYGAVTRLLGRNRSLRRQSRLGTDWRVFT